MSTEREDLARAIFIADNANAPDAAREWDWADDEKVAYAFAIADGLIAAGYRKAAPALIAATAIVAALQEAVDELDHRAATLEAAQENLTDADDMIRYRAYEAQTRNIADSLRARAVKLTAEASR
ncbi:hypothetical protein GCM10023081_47020 [Arthrobacter ginkgonis]|uniref:Uncharacterized protein n=1 Tax=Arthrobacter ginkgonis TaxID=1630594 RepID=A0ABP7DKN0_9MICC